MVNDSDTRKKPNVLITGTPGVGKTTLAEQAAEKLGFKNISVGDLVKKHECHEGMDEALDTYILDEDKLLDLMEPILAEGGCVVDFHSPEIFPERWFELVLVLRTDTEILFDRLTKRGYSEKKRNENMECEIMQVVAEEARESYDTEITHELPSNTLEDLDSAVERVTTWYTQWTANN
jgi:adenylate kinase